jgi:hypothetical protein
MIFMDLRKFSAAVGHGVYSVSTRYEYQKQSKVAPAPKADNLTATYEPNI